MLAFVEIPKVEDEEKEQTLETLPQTLETLPKATEEKSEKDASANFIKEEDWTTGKVTRWKRSHGFINMDDSEGNIFVHKKDIITKDRVPMLRKGMKVKFKKASNSSTGRTRAMEVQCVDGTPLSWHKKCGEEDKFERTIFPEEISITGGLGKYFQDRSYGWIWPLEAVSLPEHEIEIPHGQRIFVHEQDLTFNPPNHSPVPLHVKFGLYKDNRGIGACRVTKLNRQEIFILQSKIASQMPQSMPGHPQALFPPNMMHMHPGFSHQQQHPSQQQQASRQQQPNNNNNKNKKKNEQSKNKNVEEPVVVSKKVPGAEGMRFDGIVVKCQPHYNVTIKPDDDMASFGVKGNIECSCNELDTESRPARCDIDQRVSFELEDKKGVIVAVRVADENGGSIECTSEYTIETPKDRESLGEEIVYGKVKRFNWQSGIGWIEPKKKLSEDLVKKNKKTTGLIFFHRDDLKSEDKIFGVSEQTEVEFTLYTDEKGLGADSITSSFRQPLSGFKPTKPKRKYQRKRKAAPYQRRNSKRFGRNYMFPPMGHPGHMFPQHVNPLWPPMGQHRGPNVW